jgi:hypothetical protein
MSDEENQYLQTDRLLNKSTRIITSTLGILLAVAGFEHGLFEALQGSTPTNGFFIQAIKKTMQRWAYGGEDAFTLIPNYLVTGIASMSVSVFIIIWSVLFVHKRHGPVVLLLLFVLLTLVGGGIGFIPFFIVTWAYATRIAKPLIWWKKILSKKASTAIGAIWPYTLSAAVVCWGVAIEIAVLGYFPGHSDAEILLAIVWAFLLAAMLLINITCISGFAHDTKSFNAGDSTIQRGSSDYR